MCEGPVLTKKIGDKLKDGTIVKENMYAGCGKCVPCKLKRVNDWVFRLQKEDKDSTQSWFITLTYDTESVPITANGMMTLRKTDLQEYIHILKALNPNLKYYAAGEYGSQRDRPHYHLIVMNVLIESDIRRAWIIPNSTVPRGDIDIGKVSAESIAYTAKYIDKEKRIPLHKNDFREKEFSLMSKKIGKNYLEAKGVKEYHDHQNGVTHYTNNGIKRPLPRYYREKLYTKEQREEQKLDITTQMDNQYAKDQELYYRDNPNGNFEVHRSNQREARIIKHRAKAKERKAF
nr:MAG: replication initiator protein [Microvirus sp.]